MTDITILNKFKGLLMFLVLLSICLVLVSCNSSSENTGNIQVKDLSGRTISFDKPAEKIIALSASDCEILYAIGAQDKLIGRGTYCDYPTEVKSLKDYGSGNLMNLEEIISAKPDIVLMSKTGFSLEQVNSIENAGIKTAVNEPDNLNDTYEYIELVGSICGKTKESSDLINYMRSEFNNIENSAKQHVKDTSSSIYFEVSPLQFGLWTAGSNSFMNEICNKLWLNNIFDDVNSWAEINEEEVIVRNPDYIVTVTMYNGDGVSPVQEIMQRPGWRNVNAVKNHKVFILDNNSITRPGPRLVDAAKNLYKYIYEE